MCAQAAVKLSGQKEVQKTSAIPLQKKMEPLFVLMDKAFDYLQLFNLHIRIFLGRLPTYWPLGFLLERNLEGSKKGEKEFWHVHFVILPFHNSKKHILYCTIFEVFDILKVGIALGILIFFGAIPYFSKWQHIPYEFIPIGLIGMVILLFISGKEKHSFLLEGWMYFTFIIIAVLEFFSTGRSFASQPFVYCGDIPYQGWAMVIPATAVICYQLLVQPFIVARSLEKENAGSGQSEDVSDR